MNVLRKKVVFLKCSDTFKASPNYMNVLGIICLLKSSDAFKASPNLGLSVTADFRSQTRNKIVFDFGISLRIQPPLIRSRYYVRNAKTLSSRFARSSGSERDAAVFAGYFGIRMSKFKDNRSTL